MDNSLVQNGNSFHCNAILNARMSKLTETIAWVHRRVSEQLVNEAERVFPFETGGVLMGCWAKQYIGIVITHVIGPAQTQSTQQVGLSPIIAFKKPKSNVFMKSPDDYLRT